MTKPREPRSLLEQSGTAAEPFHTAGVRRRPGGGACPPVFLRPFVEGLKAEHLPYGIRQLPGLFHPSGYRSHGRALREIQMPGIDFA